jgi:hypothetical protein
MQGGYDYAIPIGSLEAIKIVFQKKDYGVKGVFFDQKLFILRST